tara:strand:- start:17 stop:292 length:276 start_codon:yes stop_codon:yes gene_type:complete
MERAADILLKRFNEGVHRAKLIRREIIMIRFDPEDFSNIKKITELKKFYIKTVEDLVYNGREYISVGYSAEDMIRVAIDLDKYESILRRIN